MTYKMKSTCNSFETAVTNMLMEFKKKKTFSKERNKNILKKSKGNSKNEKNQYLK